MPGTARADRTFIRGVALLGLLITLGIALAAFWQQRTHARPDAEQALTTLPHLRLNPNEATVHELASLPGLGPSLAQRIIDYRSERTAAGQRPAFRTLEDLNAVPGVGPRTLENLEPHLRF